MIELYSLIGLIAAVFMGGCFMILSHELSKW